MNTGMNRSLSSLISLAIFACLFLVFSAESARSANNIEFLDKELIKKLNFGIYEVVTPKLESDRIEYARELPFAKLDFTERNEKYYSIGTAFFINEKELMSAAHVFRLMYFSLLRDFYIRDIEGHVYPLGQIKKYSTHRDMVLFDLKEYPQKIHPLEIDGGVEIGDTVFSAGNAQGEGIAYRAGQVASFTPEREYGQWKDIRFTSPASPGNSGGPLLDLQGKVVGLIVKKNQSENYNIAIPIHEMDNLGNKAEFHLRNVVTGIYGVNDTVTKDWFFTMEGLPASVEDIGIRAQDDLNDHWGKLNAELNEKVKGRNYPEGERFRDYLRNQPVIKGLAPLIPGKDFSKWKVSSGYGEKVPITESQNVFRGSGIFADLHVTVEKPAGTSLKEFLDSPKKVMDDLLKAVSMHRKVGMEKVPVTSLGEPAEKKIIKDKLGRKWITSLWNLPYDDMFVYSSCLAYPKGVICLVDKRKNSSRKFGYFNSIHDGYSEFVVGYEGEVDDWDEYFSLPDSYLPELFKDTELVRKENNLRLKTDAFSIDFSSDEISGDSSIHFHMGYSNTKLLAEDIVLFELFPVKGAKSHYRVQPFYEPGLIHSDKYKSKWDEVVSGTGRFSGKAVNEDGQKVIRRGVAETRKSLASINHKEIDTVVVLGCNYDASEEDIDRDCEKFFQSVEFL